AACANSAPLLYYVAHLYTLIEQKETVQQVLEDALRADPNDPSVNNDLGYTWADAGVRLVEAERMIRLAVEGEPDNNSFLDSLGWVLYKRGRFDESQKFLQQAVSAAEDSVDAVVLDHLGDATYQLSGAPAAQGLWQ